MSPSAPSSSPAASPAAPITRHLVVRGRVQGVYYRQSLIEVATPLGLLGWVRNRSDGTVEAVVHGPVSAVQALIAWAHQGPERAQVRQVMVVELPEAPADLAPVFERRATL